MRHAKLLAACSAVVLTVAGMAQGAAITIPNFDFSVGTYDWGNQLMPNAPSGTLTSPITATLAGWTVTVNPMTFNGGTYNNYTPYANVWSSGYYGTGASGQPAFLAVFGGEPNTNYWWTSGQPCNVASCPLTGESAVLTSTGITATTVAGASYTATMAVGGAHFMDMSWDQAVKPTYTINLLVGGSVVSSGVVANPAYNVWTDLSTSSYVATTSGQSIQLQVVATNITAENWNMWNVGSPTFSNARLTETIVPEPATMTLVAAGMIGFFANARPRRRA